MWSIFTKQWWIDYDPEEYAHGRPRQERSKRQDDSRGRVDPREVATVVMATLVMLLATGDGHWFAIPFAYAAFALLRASWYAGSVWRETPLVLGALASGIMAANISGVLG